MDAKFLCLAVFLGVVIRLAEQSPARIYTYGGVNVKLTIPRSLNAAEADIQFVREILNTNNDAIIKKLKRHRALLSQSEGQPIEAAINRADIQFKLYRQSDSTTYYDLKVENAENLKKAPLNNSLETKVIIHGYMNNGESHFPRLMKDTLLAAGDVNIIVVDWSNIAWNYIYPYIVVRLPEIGEVVGDVVSQLITEGYINRTTLHFLGHSLGAHMSGFAGKRIYKNLQERVPWITGLDPARPSYWNSPAKDRLDKTDGDFVDIIHTAANLLGFVEPIGLIDFYPNGGTLSQPGCGYEFGVCSHARAFQYYAEALVSKGSFIGYPCDSVKNFNNGNCPKSAHSGKEMGQKFDAGSDSYGKMFLNTRSTTPFHIETDVSVSVDIPLAEDNAESYMSEDDILLFVQSTHSV